MELAMRVNLKVPYAEKDKARKRGARWDAARKTWYVENMENLNPFLRWMDKHHVEPYVDNDLELQQAHLRSIMLE
jgi:hypothetical protein